VDRAVVSSLVMIGTCHRVAVPMTGGVHVKVPRFRREIALRGWRSTNLLH